MKNLGNKILIIIFELFRAKFTALANTGRKHSKSLLLEYSFRDSQGREYYFYKDDKDIPILRKLYITQAYVKLINGFNNSEINQSLLAIHEAINERDNKDQMKPNIAKVSFICAKLLSRSGELLSEEAIYELAAHYFIREDEIEGEIKQSIFESKRDELKKDGFILKEFFFNKSLDSLFPNLTEANLFDALLEEGKKQTQIFNDFLMKKRDGR